MPLRITRAFVLAIAGLACNANDDEPGLVESQWPADGDPSPEDIYGTCDAPARDNIVRGRASISGDVVRLELPRFQSGVMPSLGCGEPPVCDQFPTDIYSLPLPLEAGPLTDFVGIQRECGDACPGEETCDTPRPTEELWVQIVTSTCIAGGPIGIESGGTVYAFLADVCDE